MTDQLTINQEFEYWYEMEHLLARFHQDLSRVIGTLHAVDESEVALYLEQAQLRIGAACCRVGHLVDDAAGSTPTKAAGRDSKPAVYIEGGATPSPNPNWRGQSQDALRARR